MSRTFHFLSKLAGLAFGVAALAAAPALLSLTACGGSSSETPPPLEPDPARLGKAPPPAGSSSGAAPGPGAADARERTDAPRKESETSAPPTIGAPKSPY